jgi:DNA ligase-associated metallophosphoesterase
MNECAISLAGARLRARASGALWWPEAQLLCVSDLHLGKSERMARRGGPLAPPYDTEETLARLEHEIAACAPRLVVCLGDSFDDVEAAHALSEAARLRLVRLMAGRRWIWIEGNHDPGPVDLGGTHLRDFRAGPLVFRHVAADGDGEVSGHYHPKAALRAQGRRVRRPCFVADAGRLILPAFGAYTGGLDVTAPDLRRLLGPQAVAILTGRPMLRVPVAAAC